MKEYIFLPLYRSFGLRYLLSTKLMDHLSKKYKIVAFIDMDKKPYYESLLKKYEIIYEDLNSERIERENNSIFFNFKKLIKKFICGEKKNFKNKTIDLYKIKFEKAIKNNRYYFFNLINFFLRKSKILRNIFFYIDEMTDTNNFFLNQFEKYQPKALILLSYGYDYDQYFARDAKKFNCKSISIIYSWDNPTSKGYKSSNSDYYLVWNEVMKKELNIFHDIPIKKIEICGVTHWENFFIERDNKANLRKKFFEENNLTNDKKIILFFSSHPRDFMQGYNIINNISEKFINNKNIIVVARMHPLILDKALSKKFLGNENIFFEKQIKDKFGEKVLFKNPTLKKFGGKPSEVFYPSEDFEELSKLYSAADVFINEFSTTQLEACIFDLPIINAAIGKYRETNHKNSIYGWHHHLYYLKEFNFQTYVDNYTSLNDSILDNLKNPKYLKINREKFIDNFIGDNMGKASKNIIDNFEKFLKLN